MSVNRPIIRFRDPSHFYRLNTPQHILVDLDKLIAKEGAANPDLKDTRDRFESFFNPFTHPSKEKLAGLFDQNRYFDRDHDGHFTLKDVEKFEQEHAPSRGDFDTASQYEEGIKAYFSITNRFRSLYYAVKYFEQNFYRLESIEQLFSQVFKDIERNFHCTIRNDVAIFQDNRLIELKAGDQVTVQFRSGLPYFVSVQKPNVPVLQKPLEPQMQVLSVLAYPLGLLLADQSHTEKPSLVIQNPDQTRLSIEQTKLALKDYYGVDFIPEKLPLQDLKTLFVSLNTIYGFKFGPFVDEEIFDAFIHLEKLEKKGVRLNLARFAKSLEFGLNSVVPKNFEHSVAEKKLEALAKNWRPGQFGLTAFFDPPFEGHQIWEMFGSRKNTGRIVLSATEPSIPPQGSNPIEAALRQAESSSLPRPNPTAKPADTPKTTTPPAANAAPASTAGGFDVFEAPPQLTKQDLEELKIKFGIVGLPEDVAEADLFVAKDLITTILAVSNLEDLRKAFQDLKKIEQQGFKIDLSAFAKSIEAGFKKLLAANALQKDHKIQSSVRKEMTKFSNEWGNSFNLKFVFLPKPSTGWVAPAKRQDRITVIPADRSKGEPDLTGEKEEKIFE